MAEGAAEGPPQQQNPDQKKDQRTPKAIDELSQAARLVAGSGLLAVSSEAEKSPASIEYEGREGTDNITHIQLWDTDFQRPDLALSNLPKEIKDAGNERIIPIIFQKDMFTRPEGGVSMPSIRVWMTLDKDNPRIFEPVNEDGEPIILDHEDKKLTGKEKVVERQDLLPHILAAVSGKKLEVYKIPGTSDFKQGEWKNTFDTE
jgi:hypothetical protein